jgi:hypothetical protein
MKCVLTCLRNTSMLDIMLIGMSHHTKSVFMCFCETLYEPSYEMCAYVFAKHQHTG